MLEFFLKVAMHGTIAPKMFTFFGCLSGIGSNFTHSLRVRLIRELKAATMATTTKTRFENKHLENGDYFVIIAPSSLALLLTEYAANGLIEAPLK